jgi:uncharacterized protein (TIGR01777 family)
VKITLIGASGFLGGAIIGKLRAEGHQLHLVGRKRPARLAEGIGFSAWPEDADDPPADALAGTDAIVNLAGEPVAQRWTPEVMKRIRSSRVDRTLQLAEALAGEPARPGVYVSASAIGFYGARGDETLTETSPPGKGYLADVCVEWERAADFVETLGVRTVKLRIGIALGRGGGALEAMVPLFRAGVGGKLGSGKQWMSWIHADDVAGLVSFALGHNAASGAWNATAPHPVTNAEFTKALAKALHRPALFTVPEFVLRLKYGEMASVMLASQRVLPEAALRAGYTFLYPELPAALASLGL